MTHAELVAAGYDVAAAAYQRLEQFVALLLKENQRLNLTSIRDAEQAWITHICDSLALLPLIHEAKVERFQNRSSVQQEGEAPAEPRLAGRLALPRKQNILESGPVRLLDLGTGGGLPGVPIACVCSDVEVTLLEATKKKLAAVRRITTELGLENVHCLRGRAETLAHDPAYREQFDAVTSRAVAELRVLVEYASGFTRPGGVCWFFKTPEGAEKEIPDAEGAAQACVLRHVETRRYRLPVTYAERAIVVYRKEEPLRTDLPRSTGRAKKRPL